MLAGLSADFVDVLAEADGPEDTGHKDDGEHAKVFEGRTVRYHDGSCTGVNGSFRLTEH